MEEEWRQIYPWPNHKSAPSTCEVSNLGNVRRIFDKYPPAIFLSRVGALTVNVDHKVRVPEGTSIWEPGFAIYQVQRPLAHLVANAFMGNQYIKIMRIKHIDGDKTNCRLDNLEILSARPYTVKDTLPW